MSVVKRIFRQQNTRVSSSNTTENGSRQNAHFDADDEEKFPTSSSDDTALIIAQCTNRPIRRPPLHSNSFVCLFDRNIKSIGKSETTSDPESGNPRRGLSFRTSSSVSANRLRSITAPAGQLASVSASNKPRRSYARTPTFDDLTQFAKSDGYRLNTQQRSFILQCWNWVKRRGKDESPGSYVFKCLFKREPRLKRVFDLSDVPDEKLTLDARFRKYADTFTDVLEMIVDSVKDQDSACSLDDTIGPFLCSYGSKQALIENRHCKRDGIEFTNSDWQFFSNAIRDLMLDSCRFGSASWTPFQKRNEALHAWNVLVHFMVAKIRRGYELEKEKIRLHPKASLDCIMNMILHEADESVC